MTREAIAIFTLVFFLGANAFAQGTPSLAESARSASPADFVEEARTVLCARPPVSIAKPTASEELAVSMAELNCARNVLRSAPSISVLGGADAAKALAIEQLVAADVDKAKLAADQAAANAKFLGFSWGLGIGYGFGRGPDRISEAEVVNGIVRVKEDRSDGIRAVLEAHHFFEGKRGRFGWGPFASVQLGQDGASAVAFALGVMAGWKDQGDARPSAGSWNLGVGYEFGQDIKVLGDGIVANEPLPAGETQVRYKTRPANAILILFSRRFRMEAL